MSGLKLLEKQFQFENLPMALVQLLSLVMLIASFVILGGLPWYFVLGLIAFYLALLAICGYLQARGRRRTDWCPDERTARNAARAARNGYMLALITMGAAAIISALMYVRGMDPRLVPVLLLNLFVILTLAYSLSYAYYTDRDLM